MSSKNNVFLVCILTLIFSCVSSPPSAQTSPPPVWALETPAPDATYTYFVGSGSDTTGDTPKAFESATANLMSSIMTFMGVRVTAESTAVAKATLDSYQADITNTVKTQANNRITGFLIKERKELKDKTGRVSVYILAAYETKELNKEKARIAAAFKEKDDAVAKPEAAGVAAEGAGRYFDAIRAYIEAAVAASGSDIDNAAIKMERNVNNARRVAQKLRFVRVSAPPIPGLSQEFKAPFQAKVVYGESDNVPGIPGIEVYVMYPRRQASGRTISKTERATANAEGIVSFTPPAPDVIGKQALTMRINLDSSLDLLDRFPVKYEAFRDSLETELKGRTVEFSYTVGSKAREIATAISIVDLDTAGAVLAGNAAQGGLIDAMSKEKFKVSALTLKADLVVSLDDATVLAAARAALSGKALRLVYGVARLESVNKDGSNYIATAKASIRCLDISTGEILYSAEKTFMAVASEEAGAMRAALMQIGRDVVGKELMSNLP